MKVSLIQETANPVNTIAKIASICYDSDPKDPLKLVRQLYRNGHHSVFEHVYFTFKIEGISRACSHQLVRHRMCAFTQRSQRYCDEADFQCVTPDSIAEESGSAFFFKRAICKDQEAYQELRDRGIPAEDARYLLPNACETSLYISCNLRELIHICNERLCSRAQSETRELVYIMVSLVNPGLRFMLVPKCKSGFLVCNTPCVDSTEGAI